jgi:hypothetical protein
VFTAVDAGALLQNEATDPAELTQVARVKGCLVKRGWLTLILVMLVAGETVLAAPNLRVIRTRHYEMHTDLPDELVKDFAGRMDVMYDEYARRLSEFKPPADAQSLPVYLFAKHADYIAFTHSDHTAGVFWPGENSYLASFLEGQGREQMRHTLQHEAFHQFAHFVVSPKIPTWLNEGIAELYNDAIWTGSRYIIAEIYPRRVRRINEDLRNHSFVHFEKMISMDHKTWNESLGAKDETATTYYNQAWAMVYFLTQSGPNAQTKQLMAYLTQLHNGADPAGAWKQFFPDTQQLENQFANWVTRVNPTPGGTLIERQEVLGDFYVFARQYRKFNAMPEFRNFVTQSSMAITYKSGGVIWKTDRGDAYFRNLSNEIWPDSQLYFEARKDSEPDLVCIPDGKTQMRTRFYARNGTIEHELLFDVDPRRSGSNVQPGGLHKGSGLQGLR